MTISTSNPATVVAPDDARSGIRVESTYHSNYNYFLQVIYWWIITLEVGENGCHTVQNAVQRFKILQAFAQTVGQIFLIYFHLSPLR